MISIVLDWVYNQTRQGAYLKTKTKPGSSLDLINLESASTPARQISPGRTRPARPPPRPDLVCDMSGVSDSELTHFISGTSQCKVRDEKDKHKFRKIYLLFNIQCSSLPFLVHLITEGSSNCLWKGAIIRLIT